MRTKLTAIDSETNEQFKISVDLSCYEIEEHLESGCIIYNIMDMREYHVKENFDFLHMESSGFNMKRFMNN